VTVTLTALITLFPSSRNIL